MGPSGDMLVDFLKLTGIWPDNMDPMECRGGAQMPPEVIEASERLFTMLEESPDLWLEVPAALGATCGIVDEGSGIGVLSIDNLDELPGLADYPWHTRGPLWYTSGIIINGTIAGPILFLRDGLVAVDPSGPQSFVLIGWDDCPSHVWPDESDGEPSPGLMRLGDLELDYGPIGDPAWGELSFRLADILLRRILPAAARSHGSPGMITPPIGQWSEELIRATLLGESSLQRSSSPPSSRIPTGIPGVGKSTIANLAAQGVIGPLDILYWGPDAFDMYSGVGKTKWAELTRWAETALNREESMFIVDAALRDAASPHCDAYYLPLFKNPTIRRGSSLTSEDRRLFHERLAEAEVQIEELLKLW